jgi:hypothetical protein
MEVVTCASVVFGFPLAIVAIAVVIMRRKPGPADTNPRPRLKPTPLTAYAFHFHLDTEDEVAWIEWLEGPDIKEGSFTVVIDRERRRAISSLLGPQAFIIWRYDRAKLARGFSWPHLRFERDPPIEDWGDLPLGIEQRFDNLARRFVPLGGRHPWTGKKVAEAHDIPLNFNEAEIRRAAERHPIEILSIVYNDRRPTMESLPPPPNPKDAIVFGTAYPPPDPNPKEIDRNRTFYWDYPKPQPPQPAYIPYGERQTIHIMGQTDKGKSTLMLHMFRQDAEAGKGVCVIDPHGDFAAQVLRHIPAHRQGDVIYLDPIRSPIGIDFFRAENELEREVLADDLKKIFGELTQKAGERMDAIVSNAFRLLLQTPGATFLDILRLVTDAEWRTAVATVCKEQNLREFWLRDYPKYPQPSTAEPLISRMQRFNANTALRTMVGTISDFSFYDAIREQKILICNLSAAYLRGETQDIIGSLLIMQFHLAALKQGALPVDDRTLFYVYVDEFQTFKTSTFAEIITGARKFGLRLTLANQYLDQLVPAVHDAIRSAETRLYFRLQDEDGPRVGKSVGLFTANDLLNLKKGEAIMRHGPPADTKRVEILPPLPKGCDETDYFIARTQASYPALDVLGNATMPDDDLMAEMWDQYEEHRRMMGLNRSASTDEPGPSGPPPGQE